MMIKRWNIYLVNLDPNIGTKPGKTRPAVVVQSDNINDLGHSSTVILPISSKTKNKNCAPLRVFLPCGEAGLQKESVVLVDQILAWDNRRFVKKLGSLSQKKISELKQVLIDFFEFDEF